MSMCALGKAFPEAAGRKVAEINKSPDLACCISAAQLHLHREHPIYLKRNTGVDTQLPIVILLNSDGRERH